MRNLTIIAATVLGLGAASSHAFTAYSSAHAIGNQSWAGALGLEFDVNSPITVTSLGAFDAASDGFAGSIQVGIFDLGGTLVSPTVTLSGSGDTLVGSDRFATIAPVTLGAGHYAVVAVGFSSTDQNWNSGFNDGYPSSTMNTGGGLISFVGSARYTGNTSLVLPDIIDGGPSNRYNAGTFQFTAAVPEPETYAMMLAGLCALGFLARRRSAR